MTIRTPNNSYYVSGASGGQNHTLPFGADRFEDDDLFVYVWNTSTEAWDKKTVTTHYTVSSTQVSFTSGNIPSTRVIVLRKTDVDEDFPKADFVAGASIKAQDLDNNQMQALRGIKELRDQKLSAVPSIAEDGTPSNPKMYANLDMNGYKVINQPAGYITSTDILDGTIATADVADSAITAAKLASDSVTTAKIASDAVNGSKIADNSINSEHYVDGSIDTAHIADAQITTAKIANDAVTADKLANTAVTAGSYTAADITVDAQGRVTAASSGTIGTSEIADDAVTTAKILDANVTTAKIADSAVTNAKLADAELVELATMGGNTASALADLTQSEVQILDGATVTTAELNILDGVTATATELNQLDGNTLKTSSTDFTSSSQFPAASEIDARITARIDPLGGFEAIADEDSFPATAPPAGTVVSIANANGLAVNGSGVGAGTRAGGSDAVVINGFPSTFNSTSLDDGIGLLVVATSTAHTYDFHRVVAKNEDVRQLSSDINDFKARYRIGSSNPTTDNDAGDLFFNTGTSKMLVRNAANNAWQEVQAVGDFFINTLSSSSGTGGGSATFNGTAYRFTLSNAPTYAQQLLVSINGVVQKPNSGTSQPSEGFAIDGGDIILAAAPATGADAFFITIGSSVGIGTPSDNTISTAKIIDGAVTSAKIADGTIVNADVNASAAIAGTKISPNFGSQNVVTTGSAGIGKTPSTYQLEVSGGTANTVASFESTDATARILFKDNSGEAFVGGTGDAVTFYTSSSATERMRIDSSGNVGIGTGSSIDELFHIQTSSATARLKIESTTADSYPGVRLTNPGRTYDLQIVSTSGDFRIFDSTGSSERMRIDTSGNLLVGLTSAVGIGGTPADSNSTEIGRGYINISRDDTQAADHILFGKNGSIASSIGTSTTNSLTFKTGTTEQMRIDSSGRVGINVTDPGSFFSGADQLVVSGGSGDGGITIDSGTSSLGRLLFADGTTGAAQYQGYVSYDHATNNLFIGSGGSERVRINGSTGSVGINNTSPSAPLDVLHTTEPQVVIANSNSNGANMRFQNTTTGSGQTNGLFVGIDANERGVVYNYENADLYFGTNSTERMRILAAGGLTFNGDTAAANALDDYEEGTWTPTLRFAGQNTGITYQRQHGIYTKIGNIVYLKGHLSLSNKGSSSGHAEIRGLPYTPNGNGTAAAPASFTPIADRGTMNLGSGFVGAAAYLTSDINNGFRLYRYKFDGSGNSTLTNASFNNATEVDLNFVYKVN